MAKEKPDLEKFLTDPAFQTDREFLDGYFEKFLERKEAEAKKKKESEEEAELTIFDKLFGR